MDGICSDHYGILILRTHDRRVRHREQSAHSAHLPCPATPLRLPHSLLYPACIACIACIACVLHLSEGSPGANSQKKYRNAMLHTSIYVRRYDAVNGTLSIIRIACQLQTSLAVRVPREKQMQQAVQRTVSYLVCIK